MMAKARNEKASAGTGIRHGRGQAAETKLLAILTIAILVLTIISMMVTARFTSKMEEATDDEFKLIEGATGYLDVSANLTMYARGYAATADPMWLELYNQIINDKVREGYKAEMEEVGLSEEEQGYLEEIHSFSQSLAGLETIAIGQASNGDIESRQVATLSLYSNEYVDQETNVHLVGSSLKAAVSQRAEATVESYTTMTTVFEVITFIFLGALILIQVRFMFFVSRELLRPLLKIKDKMQDLAQGHLTGQIDLPRDDTELGQTAKAVDQMQEFQQDVIADIEHLLGAMADGDFNVRTEAEDRYIGDYAEILQSVRTINTKLSATLSHISEATHQVDQGSDQVSSGSTALSQGATEQASSIEQLSAAIAEVSEQIKANAENATVANQLSDEAGEGLMASNKEMQELMASMTEINDTTQEISKIIKTIDDIAFQTNILALNAAVEAARAGAAGKGFAVVADEVRNLAGKSAEAAKDTTALIENTVAAVQNGTQMANRTAESLQTVVEKTETVNEKVQEIAKASGDQADSVEQISAGVEQISTVIQTNSATAEQSAAASQQLADQAAMLKQLVGGFSLRVDGHGAMGISAPQQPHQMAAPAPRAAVNGPVGQIDYE